MSLFFSGGLVCSAAQQLKAISACTERGPTKRMTGRGSNNKEIVALKAPLKVSMKRLSSDVGSEAPAITKVHHANSLPRRNKMIGKLRRRHGPRLTTKHTLQLGKTVGIQNLRFL